MRLCVFDDFKVGVVKGDQVVDVTAALQPIPHATNADLIRGLIERWAEYRPKVEQASASGRGVALTSVRLRPPSPNPTTVVCMAVNYMENGTRTEPAPINAFLKSPAAIAGDGDTMVLPDVPASIFEGEAELAVVIGKRAVNVKEAEAMGCVFGYTGFIDGSARGVGTDFYQQKSRATFAPIGPFIVTADEVKDPQKLPVRLWNNGTLMQDFNTDDMAHKIPRCIEFISAIHPLEPGDIVATGTNHRGLNPFQDGDRIELEIADFGRLHVAVRDDLKRTWARETRHERAEKGLQGATPQIGGKYTKEPAKT